ncbi:hypothetical protein PHMEG_00018499 [Phytophthora megakarya]|uniref:Uncharacterized protein n=1 Tax=Phytophthora megakarya TaxID=4795 RepID=A0A225VTW2_9STRA|nr:hypothetical protein PHMEG_00018499 [Phytophthora megakarya]
MWIDNTSAVAWLEKRASQHPTARDYNRLISLAETQLILMFGSTHTTGQQYDGGRWIQAWSADHSLYTLWTNLSNSWTQIQILPPFDDLLSLWETCSADMLSQLGWPPWITEPGRVANRKLGFFAVYCWSYGWNNAHQGITYGTIKLKLASIRWYHKSHTGIDKIA